MSFSKARIQRFNEHGSEAPPPGAYDPKFDNKVKGSVIEKADRFIDNKSTCSSECNASVGKSSGIASIPTFRTPQLPRKRITMKPTDLTYTKIKGISTSQVKSHIKYETSQELADLQVECLNKDKTIQEHEKHIEEMKDDVRKLEAELEELRKKQSNIEEQHTKDLETMAKMQHEILSNHDNKHQTETQMLHSQLFEVSEEKDREISARKIMETELRNRAAELSRRITILESDLPTKKEENKIKIKSLETRIEELLETLKNIKHDHDTEIILLQKEKSQVDIFVTDLTQERLNLEAKLEKKQNVILQLQTQLSALQCELEQLQVEYQKLVDDSTKRLSDLTEKHETGVACLKNNFLKEKEELLIENGNNKLEMEERIIEVKETNSFLTIELRDVQRLYKDVNQRLCEAQKELELSDQKQILLIKKHEKVLHNMKNTHVEEISKLEQLLKDTKEIHLKELENFTVTKDKEIEELKQVSAEKIKEETQRVTEHAQKMIENAEAITKETLAACRVESEERVKRVIVECDAKVNSMISEARSTAEEEMRLAKERYKVCLARMEMERTALDEKLSQRDAEITKLSATLKELRSSVETQESFSQSLQVELDKEETELAEKKEELRVLKEHIRTEAAEMVARRKRFEVIMAENQASVVALTNRLAQSNAEVERLQHELKRGEDGVQEHKELLNVVRNNSKLVYEQVHTLMEQLDAKRELVDQFEASTLSEFESVKSILEAKIENLKETAAKEIIRLLDESEKKSILNNEMKKQLDDMANSLRETQNLLLKLEERNDVQVIDISRLELTNSKLTEQLISQEQALKKSNQLLQDQVIEYKTAIDEANSRTEELSKKIEELQEREKYAEEITSLLKQEQAKWKTFESALMQQLQEERTRRAEAEEEVKKITKLHSCLYKDYEEISEKYAEVIGHQNPKQRIKHVTQLKDKIYQMEQELHAKTRLIEQLQKSIEKLKAEEKRSHGKGKENVGIIHSTPISSPHKPLTPLRNRND